MESFIPPGEVKRLVIFSDNDASFTGQAAAYKLANRLAVAGMEVEVRMPSEVGKDWADVV